MAQHTSQKGHVRKTKYAISGDLQTEITQSSAMSEKVNLSALRVVRNSLTVFLLRPGFPVSLLNRKKSSLRRRPLKREASTNYVAKFI